MVTLGNILGVLPIKGQKFENTQHSNRQGDVYEVLRVYNGLFGIKINVKYTDSGEETFNINNARDDIHKPNQSPRILIETLPSKEIYEEDAEEGASDDVKELDRKPHLLRCGCSLSIQKTNAFSNHTF